MPQDGERGRAQASPDSSIGWESAIGAGKCRREEVGTAKSSIWSNRAGNFDRPQLDSKERLHHCVWDLFHLKIRISGFPKSKAPGSFLPGALSDTRQTIGIRSCAERER
jgi:hypothetical protein